MGKVYINPPSLPSSIRGDGRYVLTVLKDFVNTVSQQVNYINGYVSNEIDTTVKIPKYFYLNFDSSGLEFSWSSVDQDNFSHYELRLNTNVGSSIGLLSNTTDVKSSPRLLSRTGTVYLYVVLTNGDYSTPFKLDYAKPIPSSPEHIAVSKTEEGTIIFFDAIPSDCIGAFVYINGMKYESLSNTFLYTGESIISDVLVCYYDSFGSGESVDAYFDPPLVRNFLVERNDSFLHFYWDNTSLYNCKYVIRRNAILDWDSAEFVGECKTNSFNCVFPNNGTFYFMIKVFDEHGNTSDQCSYVTLDTVSDIHRNIVLEINKSPDFEGSLQKLVYDSSAQALVLPPSVLSGQFYFSVFLPQKYRARNWIDFNSFSYSQSDLIWESSDFLWDSEEGAHSWVGGVSTVSPVVRSEIAVYLGKEADCVDGVTFNNTLNTFNAVSPYSYSDITYDSCLFSDGAVFDCLDFAGYNIALPREFSLVFCVKSTVLESGVLMSFFNDTSNLRLSYYSNLNKFVLKASTGETVSLTFVPKVGDILFFGISSFSSSLKLVISDLNGNVVSSFTTFTSVAYTKFIVGNKVEVI